MKEQSEELRAAIERAIVERDNLANSIGTRCAAGVFICSRRAQLTLLASKS
jgi:hypothetical protein